MILCLACLFAYYLSGVVVISLSESFRGWKREEKLLSLLINRVGLLCSEHVCLNFDDFFGLLDGQSHMTTEVDRGTFKVFPSPMALSYLNKQI